jgi:hypothetical protein
MKKKVNRITAFAGMIILFGCVSTGSFDGGSLSDREISSMAALGRMDGVLSGPLFEGEGGRDIRLAVLAPELWGADAGDGWLPVYVQGLLHSNFRKYSAMTLVDRQNLNQIIAEQDLAANRRFSDKDFITIGNLTNAQYFLTGTVQKLPSGEFSVSLSITESGTGESKASFMKNGTAAAVQDGTLINDATESLLAQMGVALTETGRRTLVTGRYMVARAEAGYARGVTAEESGASVEALLNYSQAVAFDPSQLESLSRLGSISSEISGGSVSASILNDIQARRAWLEAFKEVAAFFDGHPPFEITYDPNLIQIGVTDYAREQVDLALRTSLTPSEAGFAALNALLEGLEKTGKRKDWGFAGWPLLDITPKTSGTVLFSGKRSFVYTVEAGLVNENGKVIARGKTTLRTGTLKFKAGDTVVTAPEGMFGQINFPKVNVADLTPTLTVVIAGVNGMSGRQISETGYMRIAPGDIRQLEEKELTRRQEQLQRQGQPRRGAGIVAIFPFIGEEETAAKFNRAIVGAVTNLQKYSSRSVSAGTVEAAGVKVPTDMPPIRELTPGARYALTGGVYPGSYGNEYYLQLWLWDMANSTMIYTDDLVYQNIDEGLASLPGLVEWLLSHVE